MELKELDGSLIGVISSSVKIDLENKKVSEIVTNKQNDSLRIVRLDENILDKKYSELSNRDKNKVILASKLHDKVIILSDFSKGLLKKDIEYFKNIFKKIVTYNKKIILIDKNSELFLNCVDKLYVINNDDIIYETSDIYDKELASYIDLPKLVDFNFKCVDLGVRIDHYQELDELLKAIYRIKS